MNIRSGVCSSGSRKFLAWVVFVEVGWSLLF